MFVKPVKEYNKIFLKKLSPFTAQIIEWKEIDKKT